MTAHHILNLGYIKEWAISNTLFANITRLVISAYLFAM